MKRTPHKFFLKPLQLNLLSLFAIVCLTTIVFGTVNTFIDIGENFWPSPYGPDDERGAANLQTAEELLSAKDLITEGKVYQLGRLYEHGMPIPGKRHFSLTIPGLPTGLPSGANGMVSNDELVSGEIGQVGTQVDGLGHVGKHIDGEHVFYNGNKLSDFGNPYGIEKLGLSLIHI